MSKASLVKEYIQKEVHAGRIKSGKRLPSCRTLAALLSVNKLTVNRAYNELEREHKAYTIPRGGYYLVDYEQKEQPPSQVANFQMVKPDNRLIPYREFTHVINKAVDIYKNDLFGYSSPAGFPPLRETLQQEFAKDGVYTSPENIVITHGAQQAISLLLLTMFINQGSNRKLLVEAPTYSLTLQMANSLGIQIQGIERTSHGYNFTEMESLFSSGEHAAFYIMPRHHNPTGYNLSERNKQTIAQLANEYHIQIIEDDYLADLGSRKGSLPIHYYDTTKKTAYIRSFSKTFMPGLRIGAAVLDDTMLAKVANLKHLSDLNTSGLHQAGLNMFINSGMHEKHIKKVRRAYTAKLKKAEGIMQALSPEDLYWHVPQYGIFIWLQLPERLNSQEITNRLAEKGVLVYPASECFPKDWSMHKDSPKPENCIRLCIAGASEDEIDSLTTLISAEFYNYLFQLGRSLFT